MKDHHSAHGINPASAGEDIPAPSNNSLAAAQAETGGQLALDSNTSDGEHQDKQSVASAPASKIWDQQSVSSQSSREGNHKQARHLHMQMLMNYTDFRRILSACCFHSRTAHTSLELLKMHMAVVGNDTDASKRQIDAHTKRILSDCETVLDRTVRMHAYARDGVVPPTVEHSNTRLTSQESYNASKNVPLTFAEMCTLLNNAFEGARHPFGFDRLEHASEQNELARQHLFRQFQDHFPHTDKA